MSDWLNKRSCQHKINAILNKYDPITDDERIIFYNVLESIIDCGASKHILDYIHMSQRERKQ